MNKMLNRREVLDKAIHDCYREMYAKAQPSADWDQIVQEFKDGKRDTLYAVKAYDAGKEYIGFASKGKTTVGIYRLDDIHHYKVIEDKGN